MLLSKSQISSASAWLGLPAGLALASGLAEPIGHYLAPPVVSFLAGLPLFHPSPDEVLATTVAAASTLAPLALVPAIGLLRSVKTLPSWAMSPVGLAMAVAGLSHFLRGTKSMLLSGTAIPDVFQHSNAGVGIVAVASLVIGAMVATPPRGKAGKRGIRRDLDGPWRADWWSMKEARRILSDPTGLVLGEACVPKDEPDQIGIAPLLRWRPSGHLLTVAGSGAGKGVSVVVPNCLAWGGPLVVHDPSAETLAIVRLHREAMGRKVRVISILPDTDGVNVLTWLDPESKRFSIDVRTVVSWLDRGESGGSDDDNSFGGLARTLCAALIMFVLTSPTIPDGERHLLKVRELGASPHLAGLLKTMVGIRDVARGAMANAASMVLTTMKSEETYAGVSMHFDKLTSCLEGTEEILSGNVSNEKRFALEDILRGDTDFFICLPADVLESQPQVVRILLGALATLFLRNTERTQHDTLFVIDEMPRLGSMRVLATARDVARKHSLFVWAIVQDLGQLEEAYKKTGARSWLASPAVLQFFGVNDLETARMLSERCGDYTAIQESEGTAKGNTSKGADLWPGSWSDTKTKNSQPTRATLISPDEILSLTVDENGNPDEQLLFIRGRRPLRCGLAKYFRRREMAGLVAGNPYFRPIAKRSQRHKVGRQITAGIYGAALLGLSGMVALSPWALIAGETVIVVGNQPAPAYWPESGARAGTIPSGWVFQVSSTRRDDGFIEITGYGAQRGEVLKVLVHRSFLHRR